MSLKQITSPQNPLFTELKKLLSSKGIHKQGRFLVFGEKFVNETLRDFSSSVESLVLSPGMTQQKSLPSLELSKELFAELDVFGTNSPILVCRVPAIATMQFHKPDGLELLIAISDPSNLGTIIRSSISFGVRKMILLKESASPFHPKAVRASAGNILKIQYELGPSIQSLDAEILKHSLALDLNGENLAGFTWPQHSFLLLGEEGRGIPQDLNVRKIEIPTNQEVESLNAATAVSIAMYSRYIQINKK